VGTEQCRKNAEALSKHSPERAGAWIRENLPMAAREVPPWYRAAVIEAVTTTFRQGPRALLVFGRGSIATGIDFVRDESRD